MTRTAARREYDTAYCKKRRAKLESLGLCKQCGMMPASKNRKFCFYCLLRQSEYNKKSNAKIKENKSK